MCSHQNAALGIAGGNGNSARVEGVSIVMIVEPLGQTALELADVDAKECVEVCLCIKNITVSFWMGGREKCCS
jgi:hypothetical protein